MKVGHSLVSETHQIAEAEYVVPGLQVRLIDTPGFNDTHMTDRQILELIAKYLESIFEAGVQLNGIVFVHDISKERMEGTAMRNLVMFEKLCGSQGLPNVVMVTSKWDAVDPAVGWPRESELTSQYLDPRTGQYHDGFWKGMLDLGAGYERFDGTRQGARNIVHKIAGYQPVTMQIQDELVNQRKPLIDTAAGLEVSRELIELERRMRIEYDEAMRAREQHFNTQLRAVYAQIARDREADAERYRREREMLEEGIQRESEERRAELERFARDQDKTPAAVFWQVAGLFVGGILMATANRKFIKMK